MEGFTPNPNMGPASTPEEKGGMGALIGSIIVVAILIFGGIYFWGQNVSTKVPSNATSTESVSDIEQDVGSQDINSLDVDLNQSLETEL